MGEEIITFNYRKDVNDEAGIITCNDCRKSYKWSEWRMGMPLAASRMARHLVKDHEMFVYTGKETSPHIVTALNKNRIKKMIINYIEEIDNDA